MHLVHISPVFLPYRSGITNVVYQQAKHLVKRGHQVTVLTPWYDQSEPALEIYDGIIVRRIEPMLQLGNGAFVPQLASVLTNLGHIDLIHVHTPFYGGTEVVWYMQLRSLLPAKLVVQYHHDSQLTLKTKLLSVPSLLTFTQMVQRADGVIVSSLDYAQHSRIKNLIDDRFYEIAIGVDERRFTPRFEEQEPLFEGYEMLNVFFLGVLDKAHHFKGVDILLQAVARMKQRRESTTGPALKKRLNLHVTVGGSGDMIEYYDYLAGQLKIEDYVDFIGFVEDGELPGLFKEADVFVFPSTGRAEAFGLVALEAMSSGLPVIASNLPGVRTLFADDSLLFTPGSVSELAAQLEKIMEDKELRRQTGFANRERVEALYTWERVTVQLETVYTNIMGD